MRLHNIGCWALIALEITISAFWPGYRWQLRCRNTLPAVCLSFWQTCAPQATYSLFMKVSKAVKISAHWGCTNIWGRWCVWTAAGIPTAPFRKGYIVNMQSTHRWACLTQEHWIINVNLSHHTESRVPNDHILWLCCSSALNTDSSLCHSSQLPWADQSDDCLSAWHRMDFLYAQKSPLNGSVVSKPRDSVLVL